MSSRRAECAGISKHRMARGVSAVSAAPVGRERPSANHRRQLSSPAQCSSRPRNSIGGGLPGARLADRQPGRLRVPLAAASAAADESDGDHSSRTRRLVPLPICHRQCQQVVARRLQHRADEHAQLRPAEYGEMLRLSPTLYHSGLSGDVDRVLRFFLETQGLQSVALIGYSMGGNLVLKLAGDLAAPHLRSCTSVVGVSPAVDLAASADALHEPQNRIYERKFVRALVKRFRRKASLFPRAFDPQRAAHITSLREFDERITSLYCGFSSADDYYTRAAAARVLDRITVPTLILHAER